QQPAVPLEQPGQHGRGLSAGGRRRGRLLRHRVLGEGPHRDPRRRRRQPPLLRDRDQRMGAGAAQRLGVQPHARHGRHPREPEPDGSGGYRATMTMSRTPQLNKLKWQSKHFPPQVKYKGGYLGSEVDPDFVDTSNMVAIRYKDRNRPYSGGSVFSLWGIAPEI